MRRIVDCDVFLGFFVLVDVGLGLLERGRYFCLAGNHGRRISIMGLEMLVFLWAREKAEVSRPCPSSLDNDGEDKEETDEIIINRALVISPI